MLDVKLLLIDNYDSFTYNIVQTIGALDRSIDVQVCRNDKIDVAGADALAPSYLLMSPGPCTPAETGVCPQLVEHFRGRIPILGVCLGHQTIADVHGMDVVRHTVLMHGKTSVIHHDGRGLFEGLPNPFTATRYHSLIVDRASLTDEFEISAWTADDEIMGLRWTGAGEGGSAHGRRAVSPRELPDGRRPRAAGEFPGPPRADRHPRGELNDVARGMARSGNR